MSNYYRNRKLTESAKHEACVSCGADDGTIVWAHSNSQKHGKGMGIKAHDIFGCYLCHKCHMYFDTDSPNIHYKHDTTRQGWFIRMWEKSILIACKKGYLT